MQHTARHYPTHQRTAYYRAAPAMRTARYAPPIHVHHARQPVWRHALMTLMMRPLLTLTLAVAGIFLFSAASEAIAAQRLITQVHDAQQTNQSLQLQLTRTAEEIHDRANPAAISVAAQKLGWVQATPTTGP